MIATDTAESVASQELKNPNSRVLHSGIDTLENTPEILGVARDEATMNPDLLIYVDAESIKTETHFNNRWISWHIPHSAPGRLVKRLSMDDSRWSTNDALTLTDWIPTEIPAPDSDLPSVVQEFARGISGIIPTPAVVELAARVVQAAIKYTKLSHITVDDEDGDLDFDFRNGDNLIVMANFFPDGTIDASVYDDSRGIPVRVRRMQRWSGTSADELISLFEQGVSCAGTE